MFCYLTQNIITAFVLILQQKSHVDLPRGMFNNGNYILQAGALHPARNASALYSAIVLSQHFYVAGATAPYKPHFDCFQQSGPGWRPTSYSQRLGTLQCHSAVPALLRGWRHSSLQAALRLLSAVGARLAPYILLATPRHFTVP